MNKYYEAIDKLHDIKKYLEIAEQDNIVKDLNEIGKVFCELAKKQVGIEEMTEFHYNILNTNKRLRECLNLLNDCYEFFIDSTGCLRIGCDSQCSLSIEQQNLLAEIFKELSE